MDDEFKPQRLACSHGADLHFDGKLLGSYSTQNRAGTKSRWTELRLWETQAGNWIAESVGCSSRENEGEIREARVIEDVHTKALVGEAADRLSVAREEAMDLWGWTTAAKAFARELGWAVVREVP